MKSPYISLLIKVITLCIFAFLLVGFVAYRSGALDEVWNVEQLLRSNQSVENKHIAPQDSPIKELMINRMLSPTSKQNKNPVGITDSDTDSVDTKNPYYKKMMMGGSKSAVIFKPKTDTDTTSGRKPRKQKTIMGGSKAGFIFKPKTDSDSARVQKQQKPKTIMPGSKSGDIFKP